MARSNIHAAKPRTSISAATSTKTQRRNYNRLLCEEGMLHDFCSILDGLCTSELAEEGGYFCLKARLALPHSRPSKSNARKLEISTNTLFQKNPYILNPDMDDVIEEGEKTRVEGIYLENEYAEVYPDFFRAHAICKRHKDGPHGTYMDVSLLLIDPHGDPLRQEDAAEAVEVLRKELPKEKEQLADVSGRLSVNHYGNGSYIQ